MSIGVHAKAQTGSVGNAITTASVTTTSGSTVILFAVCAFDVFGGTPVSDSKGNTWTQLSTELSYDTGIRFRAYKAVNITGGTGHTFTTTPGASGYPALFMCEVKDVSTAPTVTADRASDATSPYVSPSIAPSTQCVLLACCASDAPSGTETDTFGGSFAAGDKIEEISDANTSITGAMAANVQASGGTFSSSVTISGVTVTDTGNFIVAVETNLGVGGADDSDPSAWSSKNEWRGRGGGPQSRELQTQRGPIR